MGITRECFVHYATLIGNGIIDFSKCRVMELGAQTVHFQDMDFMQRFAETSGFPISTVNGFTADMPGKEMHERFGHEYYCIDQDDLNGRVSVLDWDLNECSCPVSHRGLYDLVTNYGTTEHLINQTNAFRLMHDLTRPWGAMVHVLPMARMNHGFFNYNPVFFQSLARYNGYKQVGLYLSRDLDYRALQDLVPFAGRIPAGMEYVHSILIKTSDAPFVNPSQIFSNGRMS